MPMRLEYGANAVIPIEYRMHSPHIAMLIDTTARDTLEEGIAQLNEAECLGPKEEI